MTLVYSKEAISHLVDDRRMLVRVKNALDIFLEDINARSLRSAAMFSAQFSYETAGFSRFEESFNYSYERFKKVFGHKKIDEAWVRKVTRHTLPGGITVSADQRAIANKIYANRLGNGDESSGDGYAYRGRGIIQLTGRRNYSLASEAVQYDLVTDPDKASNINMSARIAAYYVNKNLLNDFAEDGDCTAVSRGINLGNPRSSAKANGEEEREKLFVFTCSKFGIRRQPVA